MLYVLWLAAACISFIDIRMNAKWQTHTNYYCSFSSQEQLMIYKLAWSKVVALNKTQNKRIDLNGKKLIAETE